MDRDESIGRVPEIVGRLYALVNELQAIFPGRRFTPDGHLVGSLGEVWAAFLYDISLSVASAPGHDGKARDGRDVQIKATQGASVGLRSQPEHLIVLQLTREGEPIEIYNGPGDKPWNFAGPLQKNGQRSIGLGLLRTLMAAVPSDGRLPRRIDS